MRLSDHDASFLYTETASGPMHGSSLLILDGELSFETVYEHIDSRLHLVPRFRQRLVYVPFNLAHPKWVDDPKFDLADHVIAHDLSEGASLDNAIEAATELSEPMLPRDKPLWRLYVVNGVPGHTILVQLGHHAMVDGASGIDISLLLFDLAPDAPAPPPPSAPWQPEPLPSAAELMSEAATESVKSALDRNPFKNDAWSDERRDLLWRATESMTRFVAEPVITAPWNAAAVGPKRRLEWRKYSFADFRKIRRVFSGTVNDVVVALVAEAAARYLAAHGENVSGGHLRLMCPVSVRREDEHGALGNRVSGIFPIVSASPKPIVERLAKVRFEMEHIKHNREAQALEMMAETVPTVPPVIMAPTLMVGSALDPTRLAARFPAPVPPTFGLRRPPLLGFNFTCTNVPGVQVPQYIAGVQVKDMLGLLMLGGTLGFGVVVVSYNQNLYFNFVCDPHVMPDLEVMVQGFDEAFAELMAEVNERANASESA